MPVIPLVAAAVPAIIGGIADATKGGDKGKANIGNTMDALKQQGLKQYNPDAAPDLAYGQMTDQGNQQQLIRQLQDQSMGRGPSLAQAQLQQATDQNIAGMAGTVAGASGGLTPGAAQWQLANQAGNIGQQAAGQSAIGRLMEQSQARGQLGQELGQSRAQDLQLSGLTEDQYAMLQNLKAQQQSGMNQGLFGLGQQAMGGDINSQAQGLKNMRSDLGAGGQVLSQAGSLGGGGSSQPASVDPNSGSDFDISNSSAKLDYGSNASGGIVGLHGPGVATVGEQGPEAIIPLTRPGLDRFMGQNLGDTRNDSDALGAAIQALAQLHSQMKIAEERRRGSPVVR